jgi:hypothetical protein
MKKLVRRSFQTLVSGRRSGHGDRAAEPGPARTYSGQVPWTPYQADEPDTRSLVMMPRHCRPGTAAVVRYRCPVLGPP